MVRIFLVGAFVVDVLLVADLQVGVGGLVVRVGVVLLVGRVVCSASGGERLGAGGFSGSSGVEGDALLVAVLDLGGARSSPSAASRSLHRRGRFLVVSPAPAGVGGPVNAEHRGGDRAVLPPRGGDPSTSPSS